MTPDMADETQPKNMGPMYTLNALKKLKFRRELGGILD